MTTKGEAPLSQKVRKRERERERERQSEGGKKETQPRSYGRSAKLLSSYEYINETF